VPNPGDDDVTPLSRGTQPRGLRRREALIRAGTELLAERGWSGLTSRAIAERAGAPPGLVHYHFGGLPALRRDVAAAAVAEAFEPALAVLTSHQTWGAGVAAVARANEEMTDERTRLTAELITASMQDEEVATLMRQALAGARARLVPWLAGTGAVHPEGLATLVVALLDGLVLHRLVDPSLSMSEVAAAAAAAEAATAGTAGTATGRPSSAPDASTARTP
jgi:DNA-binding transcriptional regulator YbjK